LQTKSLISKVIGVSLCATIGLTALGFGQASLVPTASAASAYETKVTAGVNLRTSPSTSSSIYRFLHTGENVHVLSKVNAYWLKVKASDGRTGYISANDKYTTYGGKAASPAAAASSSSKADRVISLAKSYMGRVHYDFGTRNPNRLIFDCSSFTQFIFAKVGVELKWGTRDQKSQGYAVSKSNLRKGDLIFFDTVGNNNHVINHVGIYIGSGQFIQNIPSKDGISINSLNSGYWPSHYVSARRVL
jgi:cell wall-associated NlpC family hydrolase